MTGLSKLYTVILPLSIAALLNCSPSPMLQSPRVKSNFSIGATASYEAMSYKLKLEAPVSKLGDNGNIVGDTIRLDYNYTESFPMANPCLKWGFANRVEISGLMIPYFLYGYIISGNLKIFLNEHGKPQLFRNVSYALFGGGHAIETEWDDYKTFYAGAIFATRHSTQHQEIELIVQPSYFQQRLGSYSGGGPIEHGYIDGLQLNIGTICTVFKSECFALELIAGGAYRHELNNNWRFTAWSLNSEVEIYKGHNVRTYSPFVAQCGIICNFSTRKR